MRKFPWIFSVLWLIILLVMLTAGFWQLSRADEKQLINERLALGQTSTPAAEDDWQALKAFDQVTIDGQYLNTHFLLDNQIMDGKVGYFVFTAFKTTDGIYLLVNRGWTDDDQQNFDLGDETQTIDALMADWPRPGIQLGEQIINNLDIQHLTYLEQAPATALLKLRHCQQDNANNCIVLSRVLKLNADIENGFKRQWQLPRMTVEKHRAYATQWFTMSLMLCFIYFIFIRKIYANKN